MSSRTRRRPPTEERLPSPPPTPPLPAGDSSSSTPYSSFGRLPTSDEYHNYRHQHHNQFVIGKDLCRAIKELRAVPTLRWPARSVEFSEYNADIDDDDDSVFDEADARRRQKDWRQHRTNNNSSSMTDGDAYYRRVVAGQSETSSTSIRTSSGGAAGGGISDLERTTAERYSGNYVTVTIGQYTSSNNSVDKVISADQKTVASDLYKTNVGHDWMSRTVIERRCQESTTTRSERIVDGDVVWNNGGSRLGVDVAEVSFEARDTAWQYNISKQNAVSGVVDEASANSRLEFGEDDIYERQMEELERSAVTECVDDCETELMFESSVGGDVGISSERLLAASFSVDIDDKRTTSESSGSNLSSSGVDVVNHDVDWTMHSDEVGSNECWEDSVSEKERFVRSVLTRRDTARVEVEIKKVGHPLEDEDCVSAEQSSNGFQTVFERHSQGFEKELNLFDARQTTIVVEETKPLQLISKEDVAVLSSFEQTSTKVDASCPSAVLDGTIESSSLQVNGPDATNVGLSQQNQLNYKPAVIKTIALTSFVTTSSGDPGPEKSTPNTGSVDSHSPRITFSNVASVDFTAEELFEEIMESLNDEADENDEDLFDQFSSTNNSFRFSTSPQLIQTASVDRVVIPAKNGSAQVEVEQRRSELIVSKEEEQRVVETNFDDVLEVTPLESKVIVSSSFTEVQQSQIDIKEESPGLPGDDKCLTSDVITATTVVVADGEVETVRVAPADGRLVLDVIPETADVEDDNVDEVVSPSVKSLTSFFERKPFVVVSSSSPVKFPRHLSDANERLVHDDTDVDFDSLVTANADEDDDFCLDNMVGLNLEEVRPPVRSSPVKSQSHHQSTRDEFRMTSEMTSRSDRETLSSSSEHHEHQMIAEDLVESRELNGVHIGDERVVIETQSSGDVVQPCLVVHQACGRDSSEVVESKVNGDLEMQHPTLEDISKENADCEMENELVASSSSDVTRQVSSNDTSELCVLTANTVRQSSCSSVEVVSDQLTTQEIVLTIKLPRNGRKTKSVFHRPGTEVVLSTRDQSEENSKLPFRHLHVRRVVRVIDAEGCSTTSDDNACLTAAPSSSQARYESEMKTLEPITSDTKDSVVTTTNSGSSATAISRSPHNDLVEDVISGERSPPRPVISVEFDRKSRSSAIEYVTTPGDVGSTNEVSVVREDAVRVVRLPGCAADSVRLPVLMSVGEAINRVAHTLQKALSTATDASTSNSGSPSLIPGGVRVTCEAFERNESLMTSPGSQEVVQLMTQPSSEFGQSSVTVVSRTLWPLEPHVDSGLYDVIVHPDDVTTGCQPTVTSFV